MLERAKTEDGVILIPDNGQVFSTWTPNSNETYSGEKTFSITKPLHFFGALEEIKVIEDDSNKAFYQDFEEDKEEHYNE